MLLKIDLFVEALECGDGLHSRSFKKVKIDLTADASKCRNVETRETDSSLVSGVRELQRRRALRRQRSAGQSLRRLSGASTIAWDYASLLPVSIKKY